MSRAAGGDERGAVRHHVQPDVRAGIDRVVPQHREARGAALFPALGHHPVDPGADVRLDVMPDGTPFVTPGPPGPLTQ